MVYKWRENNLMTKKELLDKISKFWYNSQNQFHRDDGPAIEWANGTKSWYINGNLHREDGPAIEWINGGEAWYINGKRVI